MGVWMGWAGDGYWGWVFGGGRDEWGRQADQESQRRGREDGCRHTGRMRQHPQLEDRRKQRKCRSESAILPWAGGQANPYPALKPSRVVRWTVVGLSGWVQQ